MEWKRKRLRIIIMDKPPLRFQSLFIIFFLILSSLFFTTTIASTFPDMIRSNPPSSGRADRRYFQVVTARAGRRSQKSGLKELEKSAKKMIQLARARRQLGGVGSSPPRCMWKCGSCTPCKAVHVPVPPGTPVTAEYYPEAWRCKCGNKLYMP